jgi:hypothetical protein
MEKNVFCCHFVPQKFYRECLGLKLGFHTERLGNYFIYPNLR